MTIDLQQLDRESAKTFLLQYVKDAPDQAESLQALARRNGIVVPVDPAGCDWGSCSGWHMEYIFEDDVYDEFWFPKPEGILVADLLDSITEEDVS